MRKISVFVIAILFVTPGMGVADDFQTCVTAVGPVYVAARDRLLVSKDVDELIQANLESNDANVRATAQILAAWRKNRELFYHLENARKTKALTGGERFEWSTDAKQIRPEIAPLAMEFLIKGSAGMAGRHAAVRIIPYLHRRDVPQNLDLLPEVFVDDRTRPDSRLAIAQVFERVPETAIKTEAILDIIDTETNRADASRTATGSLLNVIVSRTAQMNNDQRNSTVDRLIDNSSLRETMGTKPVVLSVGAVGGERALPVVTQFLTSSKDDGERRWAVSTIASYGTPASIQTLEQLMAANGMKPELQIEAVRGMGRAEYSDSVLDHLMMVLYTSESPRFRREALRSLEAIMNRTEAAESKGAIQAIIEKADRDSLNDSKLKEELDETIKRFNR